MLKLFVVGVLGYWVYGFYVFFRIESQFNSIAPRLSKQVTGDQLQAWAQAVLTSPQAVSQFSTNSLYSERLSKLEPPPPEPVLKIFRHYPSFMAFRADEQSAPFVVLLWGSGVLGRYGIEIGPTNFTGQRGRTNWQAGIYYWRDF